jgi:hypothetical protein
LGRAPLVDLDRGLFFLYSSIRAWQSVLLLNGGAHKLVQGAASEQRQVLPKHRTEPLTEQRHLLLVGVDVVGAVLREVVKPLAVLIDTPQTLLQLQELLKLTIH